MIYEAQLIGFKEGFKIGLVWLILYSYLVLNDRNGLIKPFYAGLTGVLAVSVGSLFLPHGFVIREYLSNIISMSFAVFLLSSGVALLHVSGTNLLGFGINSERERKSVLLRGAIFLITLVFFSPDAIGSTYFLRELTVMRTAVAMTYVSALFGLFISAVIFFSVYKLYKPYWIANFFDIPQILLFLAMVKLLGSGIQGMAELSLIPSVQRGIMKFTHDFVHQTFVYLMVPDHPLLKTTVWNFIAFFFGPNFASMASLLILLSLPLMFVYHSLIKSLPEPAVEKSAEKRKIKALLLSDRRKKSLPVIIFILFTLFAWFMQSAETVSRIYVPKPKPLVVDKGMVVIPIKDPTMNLMDGRLHTFALLHEGEEIRLLIARKSDNSLSVCLDACEICPPEGYGQREDHVVCIYCGTPIPVDTLGAPGGCNPIPLTAQIDEVFVRIQLDEIVKKWGFIKSGESKEEIHAP